MSPDMKFHVEEGCERQRVVVSGAGRTMDRLRRNREEREETMIRAGGRGITARLNCLHKLSMSCKPLCPLPQIPEKNQQEAGDRTCRLYVSALPGKEATSPTPSWRGKGHRTKSLRGSPAKILLSCMLLQLCGPPRGSAGHLRGRWTKQRGRVNKQGDPGDPFLSFPAGVAQQGLRMRSLVQRG